MEAGSPVSWISIKAATLLSQVDRYPWESKTISVSILGPEGEKLFISAGPRKNCPGGDPVDPICVNKRSW